MNNVQEEKPQTVMNIVKGIVAAFGIIVFIYCCARGCDSIGGTGGLSKSDAKIIAQDICESELKAPSTAKWGSDITITDLGNNRFTVKGTVDAQNSFGATVRSTYRATFTFTGEGYREGTCYIS